MTQSPRCPICGVPVVRPDRSAAQVSPTPASPPPPKSDFPFCSDRCRMVDLGRWLTGQYAIPGEPVSGHEDEKLADPEVDLQE